MLMPVNLKDTWQIVPFAIIYGLRYEATTAMRPALAADYFGHENIGSIPGIMVSLTLTGGFLSPVIAEWFFNLSGDCRTICYVYASGLIMAIPAVLIVKRPDSGRKTE